MEHVVFYPGAGGAPSFQRVSSLDEAVGYVERLRNGANVTEFSVYELTPVPLSMRAYYRVEVPAAEEMDAADTVDAVASETPDTEPPNAEAPDTEAAVQFALGESDAAPPDVAAEAGATADADEAPLAVADAADEAADEDYALASSEILAAAAAAAASVSVAPEPVVDTDDDRGAEWVAEASVIEPAFVTPELPVLPALEPFEPATSEDDDQHLAVAPSVAVPLPPSLKVTPFAVAPPVGSPLPAPLDPEPADVADFPVDAAPSAPEPAAADVVPASPGGRRSLGFFSR
jgi:hypothetical protein